MARMMLTRRSFFSTAALAGLGALAGCSGTPAPEAETAAGGASLFDSFLHSKAFQEALRAAVLDVLRSPEGRRIVSDAVARELKK